MSNSCSATFLVDNAIGLHARPAATFVQTAMRFKSRIVLRAGEREADAKSLLGVLGLGVRQGTEVEVRAEGNDAEQAVRALLELARNRFGEGAA